MYFISAEGAPIAIATCEGVLFAAAQWQPSNNCGGNLTIDEQLAKIHEVRII